MPTYRSSEDAVSRRTVLYGLGALAGHSLLAGCGSSVTNASVSQPVPSGPLTQASVTISGSSGASVGASFTGLSYEKGGFFLGAAVCWSQRQHDWHVQVFGEESAAHWR